LSLRVLAVVLPGQEAAALSGMPMLLANAATGLARMRVACFHAIPPPRVDRYDHVVSDPDREMERVSAATQDFFGQLRRRYDDLPIEIVVRFGTPAREIAVEAEIVVPDLVVFFTPSAQALSTRVTIWSLRRRLARVGTPRLLFVEMPRPGRGTEAKVPAMAAS